MKQQKMSHDVSDIIESANETLEICVKTNEELHRQNQVLANAHHESKIVQQDLKIADRHLSNIESFWTRIGNWFLPDPKPITTAPPILQSQPIDPQLIQVKNHAQSDEPDIDALIDASQKIRSLALGLNDKLEDSSCIMSKIDTTVSENNARTSNLKNRSERYVK